MPALLLWLAEMPVPLGCSGTRVWQDLQCAPEGNTPSHSLLETRFLSSILHRALRQRHNLNMLPLSTFCTLREVTQKKLCVK